MSLKKYLKMKKAGQSFLEYTLVIGVSVLAILALLNNSGFLVNTRDGAFLDHFNTVRASLLSQ